MNRNHLNCETITVDQTAPIIISEASIQNTTSYKAVADEKFSSYSTDNGITWATIVPSTNFFINGLSVGTYRVKVKDQAGKISVESLIVKIEQTVPLITSSASRQMATSYTITTDEQIFRG